MGEKKELYLVQVEGCKICGDFVYLSTEDRNEAEAEVRELESCQDTSCTGRYVIKVVT